MTWTQENLKGAEEEAGRKMEELNVKGKKGYNTDESGDRGDKVTVKLEETRPGAVAGALKAADQMTGQTFNDVGPFDDEGDVRVERRDAPK